MYRSKSLMIFWFETFYVLFWFKKGLMVSLLILTCELRRLKVFVLIYELRSLIVFLFILTCEEFNDFIIEFDLRIEEFKGFHIDFELWMEEVLCWYTRLLWLLLCVMWLIWPGRPWSEVIPRPGGLEVMYILRLRLRLRLMPRSLEGGDVFSVLICGGGKPYCIVRRGVTPHCVCVEVYTSFICFILPCY